MRASYAAKRDRSRPPRPEVAQGASIPPPVEGWDAVSPISAMPPTRAVTLQNWFPQPSWVELRKGFVNYSVTGTDDPVETLMPYQGADSEKFFAAAADTIYDITGGGEATSSETGLNSARFQWTNFAGTGGTFLYIVNGVDDARYFDGATWTTPSITGTGIDSSEFIHVTAHKGRLWFTINESSDAAYLEPDAVGGTAVKFPVGGNWTMGGYLMAVVSWSLDGGNGPDDYLAFISSRGQVSVYSGTDPGDDFSLVGTYYIGAPIGRRCCTKVGADVAVVCIDGVVPLSKALIFERAAVTKISLTERIQRVMNQAARDYKDNFGWELISYPRGTRAILNVPIVENQSQQQFVMNTLNGAWCLFTGMDANCWSLFNDDIYFGGNAGRVFKADQGSLDLNQAIDADMKTAFNYFNSRGLQKRFTMVRPLLTTDQQIQPGLAFNVDFQDNAPIVTPPSAAQVGALWDESLWDQALWTGGIISSTVWNSVAGIGYCASIRMTVDLTNSLASGAIWGEALWGTGTWFIDSPSNVVLQVNGFDLLYEKGAFI
jgi:hypothetical protein